MKQHETADEANHVVADKYSMKVIPGQFIIHSYGNIVVGK